MTNETPLHKWATYAFDVTKPEAHGFTDAQAKLILLIKAGAALNRKNGKNQTPLDILKGKRKEWLLDGYRTSEETQSDDGQHMSLVMMRSLLNFLPQYRRRIQSSQLRKRMIKNAQFV